MSPILADNSLLRATVTNFFFFLSMNGFILLPLYIAALGGTEVEIGVVMGLYNAVGIVCQPLIGPWTDAVGRKPFMLVGITLGILFNPVTGPQTRKWLSDKIFGGSDEFTYQGSGNSA